MLKDGEKGAILQNDKKTYAIAPHLPCGVVSPDTLRRIADVAEKYNCAALKVTSAARIAMVGLKEEDIDSAWNDLGIPPGAAVGVCVRSVKACPGTTFCRLGQQDSLNVGLELDRKYHGMKLPGKLKFGVSGCPNQCAETCIKDIALVGKKKGWTLLTGGSGAGKPRLADEIASDLETEQIMKMVETVIEVYNSQAKKHERMGKMMDRIGVDSFKQMVLSS
ncbi:NAD(P)/FAD-dependent oxidoreductase [Desulfonatronospira sp.]|uniref:NAD(P)/FAD-dependent oxidoreductase n=1 Tax=Desulfonatronospira sp. TaxID=1962951 RepID=UPI0025C7159F|nr:NAD(P)/FAD-dependent oxidoreductase [Desulfonatronospira sp.]